MPQPKLKTVLYGNTLFSTVSGAVMLLLADWITANLIDLPTIVFRVMGIGLLLFALDVFMVARKSPISVSRAKLIYWADIAWVVATPMAMYLLSDRLTELGNWLLLEIAFIVAVIAVFEHLAMKRDALSLSAAVPS